MKPDIRKKLNMLSAYYNVPQAELIGRLVDTEMERLEKAELLMVAETPEPYGEGGEKRKGA